MPGPSEPVISARPPMAGSWEDSFNANSAAADDDGSGVAADESGFAVARPDADAATDGEGDVAAALGRGVLAGAVYAAFAAIGWIET